MSWLAILEMGVWLSLAWTFRSYCKLWLWQNHSLMWHFLFLSPVIARFAHFLSLSFSGWGSDTLSGTLSVLVCRARDVSSIICAVNREGEWAALQTGLLLQVWDQRPCLHWNPSHSHSIAHPSALWWLVLFYPALYLGSFWTPSQKCNPDPLHICHYYDQISSIYGATLSL